MDCEKNGCLRTLHTWVSFSCPVVALLLSSFSSVLFGLTVSCLNKRDVYLPSFSIPIALVASGNWSVDSYS